MNSKMLNSADELTFRTYNDNQSQKYDREFVVRELEKKC